MTNNLKTLSRHGIISIQLLEKIVAILVTAILVSANYMLFTPWRNGKDPRDRWKYDQSTQKTISSLKNNAIPC
mgnify:CR=1 FL=1